MKTVCLMLIAAAGLAQEDTGSVKGSVRDAVTQAAVKKASVSVMPIGNLRQPQDQRSAVTDATGSFAIDNLQPGNYLVLVQHENYPHQGFGPFRKKVEVKAGESSEHLTLELIPGAAISGRVLDEDGDPLNGCFVELTSARNPNQGVPMQGNRSTNEEGEFRIYNIPAGRYLARAECDGPIFQPRPFSSGPDPPPTQAYPPQYYPLANDAKSAQPVELVAGTEKSRVDFRMKPAAITQIRGSFSATGADWHGVNNLQVQLINLDAAIPRQEGGSVDLKKGTFEFNRVFPGSYLLFVFSNGPRIFGNSDQNDTTGIGALQRVDVKDKQVETVVELRHAVDISGVVKIEGDGADKIQMNQINVQLNSPGPGQSGVQVQADGSFTFKSVLPGQYRLQMFGPSVFLKSARLGTDDVTDRAIDLSSGAAGALILTASTNTATIRGSGPAGMMLFAAELRDDDAPGVWGGRSVQIDPNGQFTFTGVPPGKYRIVAWDMGGDVPDEGGQQITVHEGETANVEVKAPSSDQPRSQ